MDDLLAFVHAQLAADERVASAASDGPWSPWTGRPGLGLGQLEHGVMLPGQAAGDFVAIATRSWLDAEHVARWDPKRALAEVEAKRRILDWCVEVIGDRDLSRYGQTGALADDPQALAVTLAVETVRLLAQPYAGRDGWREEWADVR